jgi:hypothetical protein
MSLDTTILLGIGSHPIIADSILPDVDDSPQDLLAPVHRSPARFLRTDAKHLFHHQQDSPFFKKLSPEIRLMIYEIYAQLRLQVSGHNDYGLFGRRWFKSGKQIRALIPHDEHLSTSRDQFDASYPPLLLTCKRMATEAHDVLLGQAHIRFSHLADLPKNEPHDETTVAKVTYLGGSRFRPHMINKLSITLVHRSPKVGYPQQHFQWVTQDLRDLLGDGSGGHQIRTVELLFSVEATGQSAQVGSDTRAAYAMTFEALHILRAQLPYVARFIRKLPQRRETGFKVVLGGLYDERWVPLLRSYLGAGVVKGPRYSDLYDLSREYAPGSLAPGQVLPEFVSEWEWRFLVEPDL